ncbi:ABC transporter substrate-binding protein [Chitinimonas koreensis]|uniref:ABC transporter substrate-binding protein n=1 Tax=Chitinimonas koreensis TaxID=356302 RepID=UPI0004158B26|nr:ABC transporter substrate binding protein [Chitinimonas koreensis]QNM97458.1 hypothetical protein H9L41_03885 [Chitinimonas koreensis]
MQRLPIVLSLFLVLPGPAEAGNILIFESYHEDMEWVKTNMEGTRRAIGDKHKIEVIYLDTKRRPKEAYPAIFKAAWDEYLKRKPDLVITGDDNAIRFLGPKLAGTATPVVFRGVNANVRDYFPGGLPKNITGVLERHLLIPLGRTIRTLVPMKKNRILVLFDDSESSKAVIDTALHGDEQTDLGGVTLEARSIADYQDWQAAVNGAAANYDAIILDTWHTVKDKASGKVIDTTEVLEWTGQNAPVPLFSINDFAVGPKRAIASFVLAGASHGAAAARMALLILDQGRSPAKLRIEADQSGAWYFNEAGLQKWGIRLPDNMRKEGKFQ